MKKSGYVILLISIFLFSGIIFSRFKPSYKKRNDTKNQLTVLQEEKCNSVINNMTLEEMVYQMMFVNPEAVTNGYKTAFEGEKDKDELSFYPVGGIIFFSDNLIDRAQTEKMLSDIKSHFTIPVFTGVDEEGGVVSRLGKNPLMKITHHPPMAEIGKSKDSTKAYEVGKTLGKELSSLGFNVDFAPCADVLINGANSEIGSRSFGSDPLIVSDMVKNQVRGMQENGVSATLKHFPGHGSTYKDSHKGYSESKRTINELRECEFLPFKAGIEENVDFIMISHLTLINATKEKLPSSLSRQVITDMLKNELGYKGVIITDAFNMGAVKNEFKEAESVVKAIKAGADMILMPENLKTAQEAVTEAVKEGEISRDRIEESVRKIISLKIKKGLIA